MHNTHTPLFWAAAIAAGLQLPAAGDSQTSAAAATTSSGDWCEWLQGKPGTLYKNKENPWLQDFQIEGRFQYQTAYVDGSYANGRDFNESYDEYRRVRLGAKAKFLEYFGLKYQVNLVDDGRNGSGGELDWGYSDIDEAYLSFDLGKAIGDSNPFDELKLAYGRHKFLLGHESHTSSTKLYTVERSAISNKVYDSARPTGLTMEAVKGDWTFNGAIYSSTTDGADNEEFNGWQDGVIYHAGAFYQVSDSLTLGADFVYNDADAVFEDSVLPYRWASSLNADYNGGSWGIIGDLIMGDNGGGGMHANQSRRDSFWGLVVMPHYWLVENKLQLVGQYQYQGSDASQGVRVNSRYGRARGIDSAGINSGRGDSHHSFYGGLNYYLCGHNAKFQGGIEYQTMDTPAGDFDTMTYVLAFRTFF